MKSGLITYLHFFQRVLSCGWLAVTWDFRSRPELGWWEKALLFSQMHRLGKWAYSCQGKGCREGIAEDLGMDMYILLCLKWISDKDLLYSTWNSAQCYVAGWIRGEFGGEWIHVSVWLSPLAVHLKLSQHYMLTGYTPIQNKNLKKKKSAILCLRAFFKHRIIFNNLVVSF